MKRYDFSGKNVLVTGATGGLGSALVTRLAGKGAGLVVTSRSRKALDDLVSRVPEATRIEVVTADLSVPGEAENLARKALEAFGTIDVIFNNAGIGYFALMEEATEENIRHLFELNTFAPMTLIKDLLPQMKSRGGGRVVNIVSAAGRVPIPTVGVYGASKSALAVMSNTMRLELEPFGVDVINVYPGTIDSSFEENALREESRPGLCPTDRCGEPRNEMADKVLEAAEGPAGEVWLDRHGKWLSVAAILWPKLVDRWLSGIRDKVVQRKSLKERPWRLLQVESAIACNLNCVMCPWTEIRKMAENRGIMSQQTWEAIRPHLPQVKVIDFTGGGEPLLQPNLIDWVAEAKSAGCETLILTNGLLLTKRIAQELINAGLDWLCVSMDGATADLYEQIRKGSDFETVCENLRRIAELRIGPAPRTMINFVLMHLNFHQVEEIIRLAARLGVDQVNFKQCDVVRGEHGKGLGLFQNKECKDVRRLEKDLSKALGLAKKLGIQTTSFPFTPIERPVCVQDPRDSMFVRYDGKVGPCINLAIGGPTTFLGRDVTMPTVHYGSILEQELPDLWTTEACNAYRDRFSERVKAYERVFADSLMGGSLQSQYRLVHKAIEAMPEALEGCRVCHYLYDL